MFNAAQVHLALSHFPVAGMFFTVLFLLFGLLIKKRELIMSGMVIAIISGIAIIPMNVSGEGAEEIVEHKIGVTDDLIHEHEEMAEKAIVIFEITAAFALLWFLLKEKKKDWIKKIEITTFVFSVVSALGFFQ